MDGQVDVIYICVPLPMCNLCAYLYSNLRLIVVYVYFYKCVLYLKIHIRKLQSEKVRKYRKLAASVECDSNMATAITSR